MARQVLLCLAIRLEVANTAANAFAGQRRILEAQELSLVLGVEPPPTRTEASSDLDWIVS